MKTNISRKSFLKTTGLLLCFPALFTFNTACDSNNVANVSSTNSFDQMLSNQKTFLASSLSKTEKGKELVKVPIATLYLKSNKEPQVILRKTIVKDKAYFQVVEVKIIDSVDTFYLIEGINLGDELVFNPRVVLKQMAIIDNHETKKRILKKQELQEEK